MVSFSLLHSFFFVEKKRFSKKNWRKESNNGSASPAFPILSPPSEPQSEFIKNGASYR